MLEICVREFICVKEVPERPCNGMWKVICFVWIVQRKYTTIRKALFKNFQNVKYEVSTLKEHLISCKKIVSSCSCCMYQKISPLLHVSKS